MMVEACIVDSVLAGFLPSSLRAVTPDGNRCQNRPDRLFSSKNEYFAV